MLRVIDRNCVEPSIKIEFAADWLLILVPEKKTNQAIKTNGIKVQIIKQIGKK